MTGCACHSQTHPYLIWLAAAGRSPEHKREFICKMCTTIKKNADR